MPKSIDGCACEPFTNARRELFVELREDKYWLADRESTGGVHSILYGPEITHCPFCGSRLRKPR